MRETPRENESCILHWVRDSTQISRLSLSSIPPSSAKMFTVLDSPKSWDHPNMKSQIDLTPFGVGVPFSTMAEFMLS